MPRCVRLQGGVVLTGSGLPRAHTFLLQTFGLSRRTLATVLAASWPELVELELFCMLNNDGAECSANDFAPLFAGDGFPKLTRLRFKWAPYGDALCSLLVQSPRVGTLDEVFVGDITDRGAEVLVAHAAMLSRIVRIAVHGKLGADAWAALRGALPAVQQE
jgi:hypothetical protein